MNGMKCENKGAQNLISEFCMRLDGIFIFNFFVIDRLKKYLEKQAG